MRLDEDVIRILDSKRADSYRDELESKWPRMGPQLVDVMCFDASEDHKGHAFVDVAGVCVYDEYKELTYELILDRIPMIRDPGTLDHLAAFVGQIWPQGRPRLLETLRKERDAAEARLETIKKRIARLEAQKEELERWEREHQERKQGSAK